MFDELDDKSNYYVDLEVRIAELEDENAALLARVAELEAERERIKTWIDAYPLDIFPEPDFKRVRELLEVGGITLDAVSASNMRHVLNGIRQIIDGEGTA